MHQINPTDAQRIDRRDDERGLYVGLHRGGPVWPLLPGETLKIPACHGPCDQGRKPCITPDACRLGDDEDAGNRMPGAGAVVVPFVVGLAVIAAMLAAHYWPR